MPPDVVGVVILSYPRPMSERIADDRRLLARLHENGLGTFSIGLVSENESPLDGQASRRDLMMLAMRVRAACEWVRSHMGTVRLPLGFFGYGLASTATFVAAAEQPGDVGAVVACAGRPDLAGSALRFVAAPTMLIVGSQADTQLAANQLAFESLPGTKSIEIILGGGAELNEPDLHTLVAESAAGWLVEHLCTAEVS